MRTKFLSVSFIAALAVTILLRILELVFFINPTTGFYYSGLSAFSFVTVFSLLIFVAFYCLIVYLNPPRYKGAGELSFLNVIGAVICFAGFICDLIIKLCSNNGVSILYVIFSIMAIVFFGAQIGYSASGTGVMPILCFLPIPYWIYMLISFFIEITDMAIISENLYRLASIILMLISFTLLAKVMCYVNFRKNTRRLTIIGLTTATVIGISNVAEYLLVIFNKSNVLHYSELPDTTLFLSAIYLVIFILSLNKKDNIQQ